MEKNTLQNSLNELSKGTTNDVDSIMIRDAAGNQYWIAKADLASVLGGLMGYGKEIYTTGGTSFLLLDATSAAITCSLLISVSQSQSGRPNLYSVESRDKSSSRFNICS